MKWCAILNDFEVEIENDEPISEEFGLLFSV